MRTLNYFVVTMMMAITSTMIHAQSPHEYTLEELPVVESELPVYSASTETPVYPASPGACGACNNAGCDGGCDIRCQPCDDGPGGGFKFKQQAKWWGFPEEFEELPLGASVHSLLQPQILRGEQAQLTLYDYDFIHGTANLNAHGRARLTKLATLAQHWGGTIMIQSVQSELDARRLHDVQAMASESLGLSPQQVVVATPIAAGLGGEEATIIRENHLQHVREYGVRRFNYGSFSTQGAGTSGTAGTAGSR